MEKPKVLIIESDKDTRYLYNIALMFQKLDVLTAESIKTGLEVIKAVKPDLLLIDQSLPDLDNTNLLHEIEKATPEKMPVIIATNLSDKEHQSREEMKILKAFAYLTTEDNTVGDVIRNSRKAVNI